jgi:hypothetical protein
LERRDLRERRVTLSPERGQSLNTATRTTNSVTPPNVNVNILLLVYISLVKHISSSSVDQTTHTVAPTLPTPARTTDSVTTTVPEVNIPSPENGNKLLYTNAGSLDDKCNQLQSLTTNMDLPHVIMITETWSSSKSLTDIDGHNIFSKDRQIIKGCGVVIYLRNNLETSEVTGLTTEGEIV